ncbi:hypothetical protein [Vibrio harveyi]|uniref:hypothetical protein n=1 Tax=Vibrio harveyi TaxID=669 RepID=UPI0023805F60|nr:hypothetical protein [Vibrio harveyi]
MVDADNSNSLLNQLKNMSLAVPLRSEGRKTEHVEKYAISHLLAAISESDLLKYPIQVEHSDRPDFVILTSDISIGVEVTEAVSQNSAHANFLREKGCGPDVYFPLLTEIGERRKKSKHLKKEIEENRPGLPMMGDKPERVWSQAMSYFTECKVKLWSNDGFKHHDRNWLLIDDNWGVPQLNIQVGLTKFHRTCLAQSVFEVFDTIFVVSRNGRELAIATQEHIEVRPIPSLKES